MSQREARPGPAESGGRSGTGKAGPAASPPAGTRGHSVQFQRDRHSETTGLPTSHWEVRISSHLPKGKLSRCTREEENQVYPRLLGAGDSREWRKLGRHCPSSRTQMDAATHGAATHRTGAAHPEHVSLEVSTGHGGGNPFSTPQYPRTARLVLGAGLSRGATVNMGSPLSLLELLLWRRH